MGKGFGVIDLCRLTNQDLSPTGDIYASHGGDIYCALSDDVGIESAILEYDALHGL